MNFSSQNTKHKKIHPQDPVIWICLFVQLSKTDKGEAERVCCLSMAQHSIGVAINQSLGLLHLSLLHDPTMYIAL